MVIYPVPVEVTQARIQLLVDQTAKAPPKTISDDLNAGLRHQGGRGGSRAAGSQGRGNVKGRRQGLADKRVTPARSRSFARHRGDLRHARQPKALPAWSHDDTSDHRNLARSGRAFSNRHWHRGTCSHLGGPLITGAFNVDELIPSAIIFFAVAATLGWIGNKLWPEDWIHNPLL